MFKNMEYRRYQKWFCKQYVKRSIQLTNYKCFLKHKDKTDSLPSSFFCVSLYDVLDNNGMNRLIKSIYKLKKHRKKYDVDISYRHYKFKKLNYIRLTNFATRGIIADIKFKTSKWIRGIKINFTYLNASQCLIQYSFYFKKLFRTNLQIHNFVIDEIIKIKKEQYFHSYADKDIIKNAGFEELLQLDDIFFADVLQGYICKMFYTEYGKKSKLPIEYCQKIRKYNFKKRRKLRNQFLCASYEKDREYLIIKTLNYDRFEMLHYKARKNFPDPTLLNFFTFFTTEMYFMAFYHIETIELEKKMRKYLNSRKKFISSQDIKWFINKVRYIREQKDIIEENITRPEQMVYLINWKKYELGKQKEQDFINYPEYTDLFLKQYEQNLEYLNSLASVQNNLIVIVVAVLTLFATLAGIIITLLK